MSLVVNLTTYPKHCCHGYGHKQPILTAAMLICLHSRCTWLDMHTQCSVSQCHLNAGLCTLVKITFINLVIYIYLEVFSSHMTKNLWFPTDISWNNNQSVIDQILKKKTKWREIPLWNSRLCKDFFQIILPQILVITLDFNVISIYLLVSNYIFKDFVRFIKK